MPEVIAPSEHVYRSILTAGFLTACHDGTKSSINPCGFWSTWRTPEVPVAGLAEADHMGQTLWIISVDTKLHRQTEVQERPCACVSLGSHRTTKHSSLFQPSFHVLYFFLQGT